MSTTPGLRERKKARTRQAIQDAALRLITEQGFDNTTVDEIAEAAEISPSTFFRYFPTKEDVVLMDDYDPMIISALADLPDAQVRNPIRAIRLAMGAVSDVLDRDRERVYERTRLMLTTPALRARLADGTQRTERFIREALQRRLGEEDVDPDVEVYLAAALGVLTVVMMRWTEGGPDDDIVGMIDRALSLIDPAGPDLPGRDAGRH